MNHITLFGIALLGATSCHAAVLYNLPNTVLDGGTSPNTFFVANSQIAPAGLTYSAGGPTLSYREGTANNFTYFVGNFGAFSLDDVGDSITLSYTFSPSTASAFRDAAGTFRVGLFNSNGSQISANASGAGVAALNNDSGYVATYNPRSSSTTGNTLRQRSGGNDNLWVSSQFTTISSSPELTSPGTGNLTGTFTLSLVASGIEITSVVNGASAQSVIDTSGLVTSFDSFSIFALSGAANPTLTFSDLTVSAIPEPSIAILLAGAAMVFVCFRRRAGASQIGLQGHKGLKGV